MIDIGNSMETLPPEKTFFQTDQQVKLYFSLHNFKVPTTIGRNLQPTLHVLYQLSSERSLQELLRDLGI